MKLWVAKRISKCILQVQRKIVRNYFTMISIDCTKSLNFDLYACLFAFFRLPKYIFGQTLQQKQ